jgi:ABC-type Fe3+/spermidine/putrescine transport system ATPase subunit
VKTGASGEVKLEAGPAVEGSVEGLQPGDSCHAIVRPEKLLIDSRSGGIGEGLPSVDGVVESSLYLGTATQILVRLPGEVPMTVLVPNVSERERDALPGAGAEVKLAWDPENMHVVRDTTVV